MMRAAAQSAAAVLRAASEVGVLLKEEHGLRAGEFFDGLSFLVESLVNVVGIANLVRIRHDTAGDAL